MLLVLWYVLIGVALVNLAFSVAKWWLRKMDEFEKEVDQFCKRDAKEEMP